MTAPDDLARLIAAHREVKPWVCLCGWWSAIQEPDGSDYARHLASVVSRRDADLRTRIEALIIKGNREDSAEWFPGWVSTADLAHALDGDTHEVAREVCGVDGCPPCHDESCGNRPPLHTVKPGDFYDSIPGERRGVASRDPARSRLPADTDTGRGQ